eukprot:IDg23954t1
MLCATGQRSALCAPFLQLRKKETLAQGGVADVISEARVPPLFRGHTDERFWRTAFMRNRLESDASAVGRSAIRALLAAYALADLQEARICCYSGARPRKQIVSCEAAPSEATNESNLPDYNDSHGCGRTLTCTKKAVDVAVRVFRAKSINESIVYFKKAFSPFSLPRSGSAGTKTGCYLWRGNIGTANKRQLPHCNDSDRSGRS